MIPRARLSSVVLAAPNYRLPITGIRTAPFGEILSSSPDTLLRVTPQLFAEFARRKVRPMDLQCIHEHVLMGIADALRKSSPHLLPIIERIHTYGTLHPSALGRDKSPYGLFTAEVPTDDAQQVGEVLNDIVREEGPDHTFEGWQISFLLVCWRRFTEAPVAD